MKTGEQSMGGIEARITAARAMLFNRFRMDRQVETHPAFAKDSQKPSIST